jgi:hypothetical protein
VEPICLGLHWESLHFATRNVTWRVYFMRLFLISWATNNIGLWWLNLCCQLTRLKNVQILVFLGVSVRVFPEQISIWISRLRKEDPFPPHSGQASPYQLGACIELKGRRRNSFSLFLNLDIHFLLLSHIRDLCSRAFWFYPFPTQKDKHTHTHTYIYLHIYLNGAYYYTEL